MTELFNRVDEEIEGWELGATTRQARRPLAEGDVDVGEAGLAKDGILE